MPQKFQFSLGRQYLTEDSGIWYRNYLDGLRFDYRRGRLGLYFFAGGRLEDSRVSNSEETVNLKGHLYGLARVFYRDWLKEGAIELLYEHIDPEGDDSYPFYRTIVPKNRLLWLNFEAHKAWPSGFRAWLRFSRVWGQTERINLVRPSPCSGERRILGRETISTGGFLWEGGFKFWDGGKGFGFVVARAEGDKLYVQPRLANNRRLLFGRQRLRFFGDLAHPRLENLLVWNLFGGLRIGSLLGGETRLGIVFLKYQRVAGNERVRFSRCLGSPLKPGKKDLGEELDLILEWQRMGARSNWSFRLVGSYFWPEEAFENRKPAYRIYFNLRWLIKRMP